MTERAQRLQIASLMAGAQAGHYTLPTKLLDAWRVHEQVKDLAIPEPETLPIDTAAAQVAMQIAAGKSVDLLKIGRELHRLDGERLAHTYVQRVLAECQTQTATTAIGIAVDRGDHIITEHLKPALADVLDKVRRLEPALAGHGASPERRAPEKAHHAAADLEDLAERRHAIFEARTRVVLLVGKPAKYDADGMFVNFERPERLTPQWSPNGSARWPGLRGVIGPEKGAARVLWLATDANAQAAVPTVATVDEADERWWAMFGAQVEFQRRMQSDAQAIGAMFPDDRPDPRVIEQRRR